MAEINAQNDLDKPDAQAGQLNWLVERIMPVQGGAMPRQDASIQADANSTSEALPKLSIDKNSEQCSIHYETVMVGHREIIVSITLPDCDKLTRYTEALDGRDGNSGMRVLKGYKLSDGTLIEKDLHRNTDGTISVFDLDNDNRHPDRNEVRMSESDFVQWVKEQVAQVKKR